MKFVFSSLVVVVLSGCAASQPAWDGRMSAVDHYLWAVNEHAVWSLGYGEKCEDHVNYVRVAIAPTFMVEDVYSCPDDSLARQGVCHVSALVTDGVGRQFVLDNGTVAGPTRPILSIAEFKRALGGRDYYVGDAGRKRMRAEVSAYRLSLLLE